TCGQRLQIPFSNRNKTILAENLPSGPTSSSPSPNVPVGDCPGCQTPVSVPPDHVGRWIECPQCGTGFVGTVKVESLAPIFIAPKNPTADSPTHYPGPWWKGSIHDPEVWKKINQRPGDVERTVKKLLRLDWMVGVGLWLVLLFLFVLSLLMSP